MKTVNFLKLTAAALFLVATATSAGVITGSAHDFKAAGWNGTGEICVVCHAPHDNLNDAAEMLWNHEFSTATYTAYTSPTFSGAPGSQPSGASKLCLSCHDGTVSLDSFGGTTGGTNFITGNALVGTDLSNDHPISFTYTTTNEELNATTTAVTFADTSTGTIADMLFGDDVECSSCHDVHNSKSDGNKLLLVSNAASALCLTCHSK